MTGKTTILNVNLINQTIKKKPHRYTILDISIHVEESNGTDKMKQFHLQNRIGELKYDVDEPKHSNIKQKNL